MGKPLFLRFLKLGRTLDKRAHSLSLNYFILMLVVDFNLFFETYFTRNLLDQMILGP
jgi:hypothetical protein